MGRIIGSSEQYSTWACVRSPMWKGSGYRGQTLPNNKNKSNPGNYIYVEDLGRLAVSFPFTKDNSATEHYANSMCLGLNYVIDQYGNDEADIPYILSFYLCHGQGIKPNSGSFESVVNGYAYGFSPTNGIVGYDTPRARQQYIGGVVNVTFTPGPDLDEVTEDVTITEDLFPDNLTFSVFAEPGVYIGTYTWPVPSGSLTWTQPYWTINSLTMP